MRGSANYYVEWGTGVGSQSISSDVFACIICERAAKGSFCGEIMSYSGIWIRARGD